MRRQMEHVGRVKESIGVNRANYFPVNPLRRNQIIRFLQACVLPRVLFSEVEAVYCSRFVTMMHASRVEQFQTMVFFDKIFIDVGIVLAGLTEREAMCFGRFCAMSLEMVLRWHASEPVFKAEGEGFPGCITRVTLRNATAGDTETANDFTHENLRSICNKWQARISKVCCDMLATGNYVCIRNTLTLLLKILQQFPLVTIFYKNVEKAVTELRDREKGKREDISVLASSYLVKLTKRQGVKVVEQKDFCDTSSRMVGSLLSLSA